MNISGFDWALWVGGFLSEAILFSILLRKRRWKEFPVFTALIGFDVVLTVILYAVYQHGSHILYAYVFWSYAFINDALQLALVWEIARTVMRPTGTWVMDARQQFLLWGGAGILLAAGLAWIVSPPATSQLQLLLVRIGLFISILLCELFLVVVLTSSRLGLSWRNHVMALILGWSAWSVSAMLVEGLHSYFGAQHFYAGVDDVRSVVFQAALVYWIVQFWLEEPVRRPIPPELAAYIADLHNRVKNNLDTVSAQR